MIRRFTSFLFFLLLSRFVIAQPVLSSVNIPVPGALWSNRTITDTTIQPGPTGANQAWNYSTFFISPSVQSETYTTLSGTGNDLLFPSANMKAISLYGTEDYYITNANELQYLGSKSNSIEIIITNTQKLLTVPFQYGDSVSNTPITGTGYLGYPLEGFISVKADAWGSLTLFNGAFGSTLRVVTNMDLVQAPGTGLDTYIRIIKYAWYTTTYKAPVFQIITIDIDGPLGSTHQKFAPVSTLTTDIPKTELLGHTFSISPNPASGKTTVSMSLNKNSEVIINISDLTGRIWKEEKKNLTAGAHSEKLDLMGLPKGIYLITLNAGNSSRRQRIIVE